MDDYVDLAFSIDPYIPACSQFGRRVCNFLQANPPQNESSYIVPMVRSA